MIELLPLPPPGKTGFPWTAETPPLPETLPDATPWPRVTVVTPSFNQAQFLEETIRSVLLQGYPNLEYIIMDGGSTDGSLEIIQKYAPWLAYWESAPDRGQSHAINKGWQRATGEVLAWINSDDVYTSGAFRKATESLESNVITNMVYSDIFVIDCASNLLRKEISQSFKITTLLTQSCYIPQPTVFIRREILNIVGMLDENYHMVMDLDFWFRIGLRTAQSITYLPGICLAKFREHDNSKTISAYERSSAEQLKLLDKIFCTQNLPSEFVKLKQIAYSRLYYIYSIHMVQRKQGWVSLEYLIKTLFTYPKYLFNQPKLTLAVLKQACMAIGRQRFDRSSKRKVE